MDNSQKKNKFLPNKKTKNKIKEEPIYVMTIELDQGKSGNLPIFLNSNPEELSFNFCKQYNLDYTSMDFLKNQIIKFKDEFINNEKNIHSSTIEEVDEESTRQINNNINNSKKIKSNNNTKNNSNNNSNTYIKIENQKSNSQLFSQLNTQNNTQINSQLNSPKQQLNNNLLSKKHTVNPQKIIRKNPNLTRNKSKNKIQKYITTKHNKKDKSPNLNSNKKFISLNKRMINPIEHTLFSYERFFKNLKEKMDKNQSRNKSHELKKLNKTNYQNNNSQSLNLLNNNKSQTNINNILNKKEKKKKINNYYPIYTKSNNSYNNININTNDGEIKIKSLLKKSPKNEKMRKKIYKDIQKYSFTNTGERLYEKGIKMAELENKRIKELKANLLKEDNEYTFHPKINENTNEILEESKKMRRNYKDDKSLLNYKELLENKMKKLKEKYKEENFSFTPNFNIKSLNMENKKNISRKERINKMHNSKEKFEKKLKEIENEMYQNCSFKPEFTEYSKGSLRNKSFEERQKIYLTKSQEKKNKLLQEANEPFDNKTGQELFTPLINDNKDNNLLRSKDVFDYLYSYAEKYKMNKSKTQNSLFNDKKGLSIDDSSNKIYNQKKYKTFEKIFNLLDSNNDGQITIHTIDLSKLQNNLIKVLEPLIEEIKNCEEPVYKDDFIEGCFKLYKILNFEDKQIIMRFPNNENRIKRIKELTPNFPFKPKIDKNSEKISNYTMFMSSSINKSSEEFKDSDTSYINYLKHALSHNSLI